MRLGDLQERLGGRYVIERELGRGGMGAVYLARDLRLDRPVALKVLPEEFARTPTLRERFTRETRTAASFSHPNVVPVYGVEEADGFLAYVMAFIEGDTLTDRVRRAGPLSPRDAVRLLQDVGYALAYAHGRGIVHRDIKPDNIMIERATGRALVMDFGIARVIAPSPELGGEGLTRVGEVVGTPEYMSPEQATGDHVDGRSDLYSLGLVAFFALTGRPAVSGDTTGKVLARQITEPLPDLRALRPEAPGPLVDAISRCAQKEPDLRFANAEALVEALEAARLSAPEIPLAVRLFTQELGTLSLVLIGGLALIVLMIRLMSGGENGDLALIMVLLISVLITRVMQTSREAVRLSVGGFTPDDVLRGMRGVVDERSVRRAELRADSATRSARRHTLVWAIAMLVMGVGSFWGAMQLRHQVAPGRYRVEPPGGILVLTAMILLGVSASLLVRSPFRAPLGERLFRLVWLGPAGRSFVRFASRRNRHPAAESAPSISRVPLDSSSQEKTSSGTDRVGALERRVRDLERWRADSAG